MEFEQKRIKNYEKMSEKELLTRCKYVSWIPIFNLITKKYPKIEHFKKSIQAVFLILKTGITYIVKI